MGSALAVQTPLMDGSPIFPPVTPDPSDLFFLLSPGSAAGQHVASSYSSYLWNSLNPTVPLPMSQRRPLPDPEIVNLAINLYFDNMDMALPLLHKGRISGGRPLPTLLVSSICLLSPRIEVDPLPGIGSPAELDAWDRALFAIAKDELLILLNSLANGATINVEVVGALVNLSYWAIFRGLQSLSSRLLDFTKEAAMAAGLLDTEGKFRELAPWTVRAELEFGSGYQTASLSADQRGRLREMWIDYWERQRVLFTHLGLASELSEFKRTLGTRGSSFYFSLLRPGPFPGVWAASFDLNWDPRTSPDLLPPLMKDMLAWVDLPEGDPSRQEALSLLYTWMVHYRHVIEVLYIVTRAKVDEFLLACKEAGLRTPAQLIAEPTEEHLAQQTPEMRRLYEHRQAVDNTLISIRGAFGPNITSAFSRGDTESMIRELERASGSFWTAWNRVASVGALFLLRLELYTSFGVYMISDNLSDIAAQCHSLAVEFSSPGLGEILLEDVLGFTRLLASWIAFNPKLRFRAPRRLALMFRVCSLHIAIHRMIRSAAEASGESNSSEVLQAVEKDVETGLVVLECHARRGWWCVPIYKLAKALWLDQNVSIREIEEARQQVDISNPGPDVPASFEDLQQVQRVMELYGRPR